MAVNFILVQLLNWVLFVFTSLYITRIKGTDMTYSFYSVGSRDAGGENEQFFKTQAKKKSDVNSLICGTILK